MAPDHQQALPLERSRTLYPALALLLMTGAFILTKTGRDALYFQRDGLFDLPWAYLGLAFLSLPMGGLVLMLMRSLGTRPVRVAAPLAMASLQVVFFWVARPGGGWEMTLFFILIPLIYGVLLAMMWLLGAELIEASPKKHLGKAYATLGSASMLGGMIGGLAAKLLAPYLDPRYLIMLGAVGLVLSAAVAFATHRRFRARRIAGCPDYPSGPAAGMMPPPEELLSTLRYGYVRTLLAVAVMAALVGVLIEFQFYLVAATSGSGGRENSGFFANFYIVLSLVGLMLQLFAMPPLQRLIGVNGSLLVLPVALFGGSAFLALGATGLGRIALRVTEGGLKSSIHRSNWEQAYLAVGRARRSLVKIVVDGMGAHLAEGLAAAFLLAWLHLIVGNRDLVGLDVSWMTYVIVAGALLWTAVTVALGRHLTPQNCAEIEQRSLRENIPLPDS